MLSVLLCGVASSEALITRYFEGFSPRITVCALSEVIS